MTHEATFKASSIADLQANAYFVFTSPSFRRKKYLLFTSIFFLLFFFLSPYYRLSFYKPITLLKMIRAAITAKSPPRNPLDWMSMYEGILRKAPYKVEQDEAGEFDIYPVYFEISGTYQGKTQAFIHRVRTFTASLLRVKTNPQALNTAQLASLNCQLTVHLDCRDLSDLDLEICQVVRTVLIRHQTLSATIDDALNQFDADERTASLAKQALNRLRQHVLHAKISDPKSLSKQLEHWDRSRFPARIQSAIEEVAELFEKASDCLPLKDKRALKLFRKELTARIRVKEFYQKPLPQVSSLTFGVDHYLARLSDGTMNIKDVPFQYRFQLPVIKAAVTYDFLALNDLPLSVLSLQDMELWLSERITFLIGEDFNFSKLKESLCPLLAQHPHVKTKLLQDYRFFSRLPVNLYEDATICELTVTGLVADLSTLERPLEVLGHGLFELSSVLGFDFMIELIELEKVLSRNVAFASWIQRLNDPLDYIKRLPAHMREHPEFNQMSIQMCIAWAYREFIVSRCIDWQKIRELFWLNADHPFLQSLFHSSCFRALLRHDPTSYYSLPQKLQENKILMDVVAPYLIDMGEMDERCLLDHWQKHPRVLALNLLDELEFLSYPDRLLRVKKLIDDLLNPPEPTSAAQLPRDLKTFQEALVLQELFKLAPAYWEELQGFYDKAHYEVVLLFASSSSSFKMAMIDWVNDEFDKGRSTLSIVQFLSRYSGLLEQEAIALALVEQNGLALSLLPESIRSNKAVVERATMNDGRALWSSDFIHYQSLDLLFKSFITNPYNYTVLPPFWQQMPVVIHALLTSHETGLSFLPALQDDLNSVWLAVTHYPTALRFASPRLQNHPNLLQLVGKSPIFPSLIQAN